MVAAEAAELVRWVNVDLAPKAVMAEWVRSMVFLAPQLTTVVVAAPPTLVQGEPTEPVDQGVAAEWVLMEPPIRVAAVVAVRVPPALEQPAAPAS